MSKPRGRKSTGAKEQRTDNRAALSLATAQKMLPLVAQVVQDIQARWHRISKLEAEQVDLELRRRKLEWPQRARRYQLAEDITFEQNHLQEAVTELEQLEVMLIDPVQGEAAFPTVINGRRAYFGWRLGAQDLSWWCYANDPVRHPIPDNWRGV